MKPLEERQWRPRTGKSNLWFSHNLPNGLIWYSINQWHKRLNGWVVFPGMREGDLTLEAWERTIMSVVRKGPPGRSVGVSGIPEDDGARARWPGLWEHLTLRKYPETGEPRKTSTVTLFVGPQGLQACLADKDNGMTCFAVAETLLGLLDALEMAVQSPHTVWREDKLTTGSSARIKKHPT